MESRKILQADLLDLLFENRNKSYGAYHLRKTYNKRIGLALIIAFGIAVSVFGGIFLLNSSVEEVSEVEVREVVVQNIEEVLPPPPPPPPPPPEKEPPRVKEAAPSQSPPKVTPPVKTTKFTPPVIKKDNEVKNTEVPEVSEIAKVDAVSSEGLKDEGIITNLPPIPSTVDKGTGIVEAPKPVVDENKIFTKVEIQARVNISLWRRHLENQLTRYIEDAANSGMSAGKYTVNVRFLVEKDGSIGDVRALNDPGYGLAKGAVDVVKRGPKWSPGEQNGRKVRSYHTQPITFVITDGYM